MQRYNSIKSWKDKYGDIYNAKVKDIDFYFRLITRNEYNTLKAIESDNFRVDEMVVELCVIDPIPEEWTDEIYAGITSTLAYTILEESLIISKPDAPQNHIEGKVNKEYEHVSTSFEQQMPIMICRAFPSYILDDVINLPLPKQIELYARAVWLLNEIEDMGIEFSED